MINGLEPGLRERIRMNEQNVKTFAGHDFVVLQQRLGIGCWQSDGAVVPNDCLMRPSFPCVIPVDGLGEGDPKAVPLRTSHSVGVEVEAKV